jgi:hypothetical protein
MAGGAVRLPHPHSLWCSHQGSDAALTLLQLSISPRRRRSCPPAHSTAATPRPKLESLPWAVNSFMHHPVYLLSDPV